MSFSTECSMIAVVAIAMASASISSDMSTVFTCALKAAMLLGVAPGARRTQVGLQRNGEVFCLSGAQGFIGSTSRRGLSQ